MNKQTLKNGLLGLGTLAVSALPSFGQSKEAKVVDESYTVNQTFYNDSTRTQDKKDMANFSIDPKNNISKGVNDYGNFRMIKEGEFPNETVTFLYEEKVVGIYNTNGMDLRTNPNVPKPLLDMYMGNTALQKDIDCLEAELANQPQPKDKTFRRNVTVEPGFGLTRSLGDIVDNEGNPLINAPIGGILSFGGNEWSFRPLVSADFPLVKDRKLEDEVSTYEHRTDSPFGQTYIITTREVNKQEDLKKSPIIGAGLRIYPNKKKDLHLDFLAGFAPGQYIVKGTHEETDISKEVFDKNGFYLQNENASLGTYDMGSSVDKFNVAQLKAGVGSGRVAVYGVFQAQIPEADGYNIGADNAQHYVGVALHLKLGLGKGDKK